MRRLVSGFPPRRPGFDPRLGNAGFVVDKVILGQVFSEYFGNKDICSCDGNTSIFICKNHKQDPILPVMPVLGSKNFELNLQQKLKLVLPS
jgi:hypothetical protein